MGSDLSASGSKLDIELMNGYEMPQIASRAWKSLPFFEVICLISKSHELKHQFGSDLSKPQLSNNSDLSCLFVLFTGLFALGYCFDCVFAFDFTLVKLCKSRIIDFYSSYRHRM